MKKFLVSLFTLTACGSINISPDPSIPATLAHFPTAEISACDRLFHGLGVCLLHGQTPFTFEVQTYYQGVVTWNFDNDPNIHSQVYKNNERITIEAPQGASVVSFLVTPEIKESTEPVESLQGFLYLRQEVRPTYAFTLKAPENSDVKLQVLTHLDDGIYDSLMYGCGVDIIDKTSVKNHIAEFPLHMPKSGVPCIVNGGLKGATSEEFAAIIAHYTQGFVPLPIPSVTVSGNSLKVDADKTVTLIVLDNQGKFGTSESFNFNPKVLHTVRTMTIKGRTAIGQYAPGLPWVWLQ